VDKIIVRSKDGELLHIIEGDEVKEIELYPQKAKKKLARRARRLAKKLETEQNQTTNERNPNV